MFLDIAVLSIKANLLLHYNANNVKLVSGNTLDRILVLSAILRPAYKTKHAMSC